MIKKNKDGMNLIVIPAILIVLICIVGCTVGPEATENEENELIQNCLNKYYDFINGEICVSYSDKSSMYDVYDIFRVDENHNKFTFYDSNDNGIPELHLSSMRSYYVIECANDALVMLYSGTGYETLLNNGAVLYTRYGGAPDHISYKYTELDPDNNIIQTTFEKYNGDMEGDYDYFLVDGQEVTKSKFDEIAEKYLNIDSDGIIWSDYWTFLFENADEDNSLTPVLPDKTTPYSGVIDDFILSIKNNDAESFKQMICPSGLIAIRNFGSGFGTRGKDIRNLYAMDEIPDNLQFKVSSEMPVTLHDLFTESQQCEVSDIPVTKINDRYFNFTDHVETENYGPLTEEVRDLCSELTSDYSPSVFELGEKEVVLTESSLDGLVGVWAVFERHNDQYLLRAVIDLR